MTDEELADEYVKEEGFRSGGVFGELDDITSSEANKEIEQAFLAGLKAGRPQWHDLRKNPNDLPEDTYDVLDQAGYKVHYNFFQNVWVNDKDEIDENVIAWKEIVLPELKESK